MQAVKPHCSRVRRPRFPQLALRPHPSRQWLRIRFSASGPLPKRRSAPRPGSATHGYRRPVAHAPLPSGHGYETTTQKSSLPDEGMRFEIRLGHDTGNAIVPRYRERYRIICPNGATHTSPGHRAGNHIPENWCVLKEHCIGKARVCTSNRVQNPTASFQFQLLALACLFGRSADPPPYSAAEEVNIHS